ncbi:MAG: hypothetical protein R2857_13870 [Vampirovibrionales bacterium]
MACSAIQSAVKVLGLAASATVGVYKQEIDLRGIDPRQSQALALAYDGALRESVAQFHIIHGKGTGVLQSGWIFKAPAGCRLLCLCRGHRWGRGQDQPSLLRTSPQMGVPDRFTRGISRVLSRVLSRVVSRASRVYRLYHGLFFMPSWPCACWPCWWGIDLDGRRRGVCSSTTYAAQVKGAWVTVARAAGGMGAVLGMAGVSQSVLWHQRRLNALLALTSLIASLWLADAYGVAKPRHRRPIWF